MTNWKEYKLGELCTITSSKRIFYKEYVSEGVPFFRSKEIIEKANGNDISTELFITKDKFQEIKDKFGVPLAGDILLTSVGTLGVSYQVQESDYFYFKDGNLTWFKDFSDEINTKFLLYWLRSPLGKEGFNSITIGSTQAALTIAGLKGIKLSIPDLPTQTAIAEILSSLDDKIELNNKINQELENLAQTLFKQWFIDFEFPNENGEPYKSSGGELVDSELGEIPKGWEVGTFGDLCKVVNGYAFKSKDFEETGSNGILKIRNVNGSVVDIINTQFVASDVVASVQEKFRVLTGHILIAMTGAEVGKTGIVPETNKSLWLNQRVGRFEPIIEDTIVFIYHMFTVLNFTQAVRNSAMGSAQPNISASGIESLNCLIPPNEIILLFSSINQDSFNLALKNLGENQELSLLRDALLPKLITGELQLNELD